MCLRVPYRLNHGAGDERWRTSERCAPGIESYEIPKNAVMLAAIWAVRRDVLPQQLGDEVLLVPILRGPHIRKLGEDRQRRTLPVAGQNGLPDYKDAQLRVCLLLK